MLELDLVFLSKKNGSSLVSDNNFLVISARPYIPGTMETRCFHKKLEFQDTRQKISVPLAMSANLPKKGFELFNPPPPK